MSGETGYVPTQRHRGTPAERFTAILARTVPDMPEAVCRDQAGAWDGDDPRLDAWAVAGCRRCPELAVCLMEARKRRPVGVIQAGIRWGTRGPLPLRVA